MSDSGAGVGKDKVGGAALSKPCQWPHVRARRRFAATRPPLLIWIRPLNQPGVEQEQWEKLQRRGAAEGTRAHWSLRLHLER